MKNPTRRVLAGSVFVCVACCVLCVSCGVFKLSGTGSALTRMGSHLAHVQECGVVSAYRVGLPECFQRSLELLEVHVAQSSIVPHLPILRVNLPIASRHSTYLEFV